jgi:hypothetical protein
MKPKLRPFCPRSQGPLSDILVQRYTGDMFKFTDRLSSVSQQVIAGLIILAVTSGGAWLSPTFLHFIVRTAGSAGAAVQRIIIWVIAHRGGIGLLLLGALIAAPFIWRFAFRQGYAVAISEAERAKEAAARLPILSDAELSVIRLLVAADGSSILVDDLQTRFGWSFFQTRITIGELASKGLTESMTDILFGGQVRIRLTGIGIDYAVRSGLLSVP